jgi:hypothetical protein
MLQTWMPVWTLRSQYIALQTSECSALVEAFDTPVGSGVCFPPQNLFQLTTPPEGGTGYAFGATADQPVQPR